MNFETNGTRYIRVIHSAEMVIKPGTRVPVSPPLSRVLASLARTSPVEPIRASSTTRSLILRSLSMFRSDWIVGKLFTLWKTVALSPLLNLIILHIKGGFKSQLVYDPGAYIAAASYPNVNHRIFTIDRDNKLCVTEYDTSSWAQTKQLTDTIAFSPAAAILVAGSTRVRVYTQIASGQIAEWGTNDGKTYLQFQKSLPTN